VSAIIGGFIIAVTRDLSIGDFVRIGDYRGKIIDISLTKIALLNEDDDLIYIANDKAYLAEIINYSRGDIRRVSIAFELSTSFVGTVEALEANLIKELDQYKENIAPDSFNLRIVDISKDAISFKFQYTLAEVNRDLEKEIKKKTVRRVLNYVKQQSLTASS
jgi:small-conductance mechanosensitive channel